MTRTKWVLLCSVEVAVMFVVGIGFALACWDPYVGMLLGGVAVAYTGTFIAIRRGWTRG